MTEHAAEDLLGKGKGEDAKIPPCLTIISGRSTHLNQRKEEHFSISLFDEQALGGSEAKSLLAVVIIDDHRSVKRFDGLDLDFRSQPNVPTIKEFQEFRRGMDDS